MIRGADFSSFQDVEQVRRTLGTIDFGFVKASESTGYRNPLFHDQVNALAAAGKRVGFYHFLSALHNGVDQWDHFESSIVPYRGIVCVDHEPDPSAGGRIPDPAIARAFIKRGQQRGFRVGRYGSAGQTMAYSLGEDWRWVAAWGAYPPRVRFDIWQVAGSGSQDWDSVLKSKHDFEVFWNAMTKPRRATPKPRWWIVDDATHVALGPMKLTTVGPRIAAYRVRHRKSMSFHITKR